MNVIICKMTKYQRIYINFKISLNIKFIKKIEMEDQLQLDPNEKL